MLPASGAPDTLNAVSRLFAICAPLFAPFGVTVGYDGENESLAEKPRPTVGRHILPRQAGDFTGSMSIKGLDAVERWATDCEIKTGLYGYRALRKNRYAFQTTGALCSLFLFAKRSNLI